MVFLQITSLEIADLINIILDGVISTVINNFFIYVFDKLKDYFTVDITEIFCLTVFHSIGVIRTNEVGFTVSKECFRIRSKLLIF